MNILALDTTSEFGSLAVSTGGEVVAEQFIHSREGFAHIVFGAVEEVLGRAGLGLEEIDCFAAASGPGSFTGVRVGLAAVKGLAEALGKRAAGISNLQALAWYGTGARRAVMLDARRGEIYAAVYGAELEPLAGEVVVALETWLGSLGEEEYEFIGEAKFRAALAGTRFEGMKFVEAPRSLAAGVAYCAERLGGGDAAALDANYVRRSDAELFWKDG